MGISASGILGLWVFWVFWAWVFWGGTQKFSQLYMYSKIQDTQFILNYTQNTLSTRAVNLVKATVCVVEYPIGQKLSKDFETKH